MPVGFFLAVVFFAADVRAVVFFAAVFFAVVFFAVDFLAGDFFFLAAARAARAAA